MPDTITPEYREKFALALEERRLALGITLREVARRASISYEVIRNIKSGAYRDPRALTLRGIDRALEWTPNSTHGVLYFGRDPVGIEEATAPGSAEGA